MKKKLNLEQVMKVAAPIIQKRSEAANEMLTAIGKEMMEDQTKWLDEQMRDILPPALYQAGLDGKMEALIGAYLERHKIGIVFVPDRLMLQIEIAGRVHSRFIPTLTCDGEEVKWAQAENGFSPDQNN